VNKPVRQAVFKIVFFFFSKNQDNETCLSAHLVRTINSWNKICVVTNYRIKIIILFHILLFLTITIIFLTKFSKQPENKNTKKKKKRGGNEETVQRYF
jgi:hypothetical protein